MKISRITESLFLRDALSLSGGTAIAQIIAFLSLPLLTRLYSPEDFGILALYVAISSLLAIFATLKIEQVIMLPDSDSKAFLSLIALCIFSFLFSIVIFLLLISLFDILLSWMNDYNDSMWLYYVPLSVFFFSCYQGLRFWLMRQKKFALISISLISSIIIGTIVSAVIGIFFKGDIINPPGLIVGYIAEGIIKPGIMLIGFFNIEKNNYFCLNLKKIYYSVLRYKKLVLTLLISHGISALYSRALIMAIELMYGASILGYYSMAQKIISAPPALIANALGDVFRQRASVLWRENQDFSGLFKKTLLLSSVIGIPIYAIGIGIAPDVFAIVLGENWRIAGEYASILMISGVFAFIATPVDKGAIIVGAHKYIFKWHLFRLISYLLVISVVGYSDYKMLYFLCLIVLVDVCMWVLDCMYEYRFSKGILKKLNLSYK